MAGSAAIFDQHVRPPGADEDRLRVVVCGTFRRDREQLAADHAALRSAGCEVLSPRDVAFVAELDGFALAAHELGKEPKDVEAQHIAALEAADMIWLHAPQGYVGPSAALELGVAHALRVPVYARELPTDTTLRHFASLVTNVGEAVAKATRAGQHTPSRPLAVLQEYYRRIASVRGYEAETPQDTMLLLTEEVGELARAVRKRVGLQRAGGFRDESAADELADVQLYVLHLANVLGVSLDEAVTQKERRNAAKMAPAEVAA